MMLLFYLIIGLILSDLKAQRIFSFNPQKWHSIRNNIEAGLTEQYRIKKPTEPATERILPEKIQLPDADLSLYGRLFLGLGTKYIHYLNRPELSRVSFDMQQDLETRFSGTIGDKINVNMDYNPRVQKQDISLTYKGRADEVMREVQFGDVVMALPQTEFLGYSRQLFGLKLHGEYKNLKFWGIGSQTKGSFETKRFFGNTTLERREILDTDYIKQKYYDITFEPKKKIKPGTEKVYLDDRNPANDHMAVYLTAVDYNVRSSSYTGYFHILVPEQDYVIDYPKGIIMFRKAIQPNFIIAIQYKFTDDTELFPVIIKTENDLPIEQIDRTKAEAEIGYKREIKNFYNIGRTNILRPIGPDDFIIRIEDYNRTIPTKLNPGRKPVPKYPEDIIVDFETGIFYILSPSTAPERERRTPFPEPVYERPQRSFYKIFVEYRTIQKMFHLKPMIVPYSERVTLNGVLLTRNKDYFIDYDSGILTFIDESKIINANIEVSYEYNIFGLGPTETLLGTRVEWQAAPNILLGGTWIGTLPRLMDRLPDPRNIPSNLQAFSTNAELRNIKLGPLRTSLSGEYAESNKNLNVMGKAMIDSMEGVKLSDPVSLHKEAWQQGANPRGTQYNPYEIESFNNEQVNLRDINPNITDEIRIQALVVRYNIQNPDAQLSIVHPLSHTGLDLSKKTHLELWLGIFDTHTLPEEINIQLGSFNEDADGDRIFDAEDRNRNNTLDMGEDTGWEWNYRGERIKIGAGNGIINTEDLDNDGQLDGVDLTPYPHTPYKISPYETEEKSKLTLGWKRYEIPLNIVNEKEWTNIKQIRITIKGIPGQKGTLKIAKLLIVGNRWENLSKGSLKLISKNTEDNPDYKSLLDIPYYRDELHREGNYIYARRLTEQTLVMDYTITPSTPKVETRQFYIRPQDFSTHKKFRFFLWSDKPNITFFIRIGNKENYFEYKRDIDSVNKWELITINQEDINKDERPDVWKTYDVGMTTYVGKPSLTNISEIRIGVLSKTHQTPISGQIYINEIHLADAYQRRGVAIRGSFGFELPGFFSGNIGYKTTNRNFETFTQSIFNRDLTELSGSLSIPRTPIFPLLKPISLSYSRTETDTPSPIEAGDLVSVREGQTMITQNARLSTNINLPLLPPINYSYTKSISSSNLLKRTDFSDSHSAEFTYNTPHKLLFIPRPFFLPTSIAMSFRDTKHMYNPWDIGKATGTIDHSQEASIRLPFKITRSINFNINTLSVSRISSRDFIAEDTPLSFPQQYPKTYLQDDRIKSASQSLGASLDLGITRFISPRLGFTSNITENYNFPASTHKTINRNTTLNVSNNFLFSGVRFFKPLTTLNISANYTINDGDTYELVESTYQTILDLKYPQDTSKNIFKHTWIRNNPITPENPSAYRKILNLQDTISANARYSFEWLPHQFSTLKNTTLGLIFSESKQTSEQTNTSRTTLSRTWPDLTLTLYDIEQLLNVKSYKISRTDIGYSRRTLETIGYTKNQTYNLRISPVLEISGLTFNVSYTLMNSKDYDYQLNKFTKETEDNTISLNFSYVIKDVRITPTLSISTQQEWPGEKLPDLKPIRDLTTYTISSSIYHDTSFPSGIQLPFLKKPLPLTNRLTTNANLSYIRRTSTTDLTGSNTDQLSLNFTSDYTVAPNIRIGIGGGGGFFINRFREEQDNTSFNIETRITITL